MCGTVEHVFLGKFFLETKPYFATCFEIKFCLLDNNKLPYMEIAADTCRMSKLLPKQTLTRATREKKRKSYCVLYLEVSRLSETSEKTDPNQNYFSSVSSFEKFIRVGFQNRSCVGLTCFKKLIGLGLGWFRFRIEVFFSLVAEITIVSYNQSTPSLVFMKNFIDENSKNYA